MRVPKGWVPVIASEIVEELINKDMVKIQLTEDQLKAVMEELIMEELMVEDRINDEVREMLKQFDSEIEKGHLDYRKLFDMTKKKLIRERNIII
jgi:hypothetical protein